MKIKKNYLWLIFNFFITKCKKKKKIQLKNKIKKKKKKINW